MGIRVVGKDTLKEQEVANFLVRKSEVGTFLFKLKRVYQSWKEPVEIEKVFLKLEIVAAVGNFWLKLVPNQLLSIFPSTIEDFKLHSLFQNSI